MKHLVLCIALVGCTSSAAPSSGISNATCPAGSTITYDNFGRSFFSTNCLSCHAGTDLPILSTRAQIRASTDMIMRATVDTTEMPQTFDIDVSERQMLGEWLACEAP